MPAALKYPNNPLTDEQRQFATDNHALLVNFLLKKHLPRSEWYDVAAFGYLRAVQVFDRKVSPYFPALAYKAMQNAVAAEYRRIYAKKRIAKLVSLDDETMQDSIRVRAPDEMAIERILLAQSLVCLDTQQRRVANCLLSGMTQVETGKILGFNKSYIWRKKREICSRLQEGESL